MSIRGSHQSTVIFASTLERRDLRPASNKITPLLSYVPIHCKGTCDSIALIKTRACLGKG